PGFAAMTGPREEGIGSTCTSRLTARPRPQDNSTVEAVPVHRIVVVEDHPLFRDGVVQCLDAEPDLTVVGDGATATIDVDALRQRTPDLVLMDVELPDVNGIDATRALREALPDLRVVMLTAFADADLLFAAMQAGAAGYVLKHTPAPELVATVRRIAA